MINSKVWNFLLAKINVSRVNEKLKPTNLSRGNLSKVREKIKMGWQEMESHFVAYKQPRECTCKSYPKLEDLIAKVIR